MTTVEKKIAIIGAGVFGLSTALHLKKRGYEHVTVYDYQPYDVNAYDPSRGCDSASADVNKIYRCSYGTETEYQDLAYSGRPIWLDWNAQIANSKAEDLPQGLTPQDELLVPCGFLRLSGGPTISAYDQESLDALEKAGLRDHQYVVTDQADMMRLEQEDSQHPAGNWMKKLKAFHINTDAVENDGNELLGSGFLDTSAGFTYADKACTWTRHLAEKAGVNFVLGPEVGRFNDFLYEKSSGTVQSGEERRAGGEVGGKKVRGLRTKDGREHEADVVIVAGGGWTPSIVPEVEGLLQTTAGSVVTIDLPHDRQDLWDKFSPERFPVWAYGLTGHNSPEFGGFYGFPRTKEGKIKIGYRGRKWTNFQFHPKTGQRMSVPKTKYTDEVATNLPLKAINNIKRVVELLFPELKDIGITDTRMCWYTDSIDNNFVIDYVPGYNQTLLVASGGSGHGFKFLPVLGEHVVNSLERRKDQFTHLFKWRSYKSANEDMAQEPQEDRKDREDQDHEHGQAKAPRHHANGLDEGEASGRDLKDLQLANEKDWTWSTAINSETGS